MQVLPDNPRRLVRCQGGTLGNGFQMGLVTYRATFLQCLPHQSYVKDMAKLGLVDIAPELLQEMSVLSKHKQQYDTEAMQHVAAHMNLKPCEDAQFSQVNSMALAPMVNTHATDGNQLLCSITSAQVHWILAGHRRSFICWLYACRS
jgi:hypothetical protein